MSGSKHITLRRFSLFSGIYRYIHKKTIINFNRVSGLSVNLEPEEIAEGGENRFKHKLPIRTKYANLVLKRGLLIDSGVIEWCRKA